MNEPVADAVRGILDGHVVLDRELAHRNHYPAIDVLQSVSRLAPADPVARRPRGGRPPARGAGDVPRQGGPDRDRRLRAGLRPARSTTRSSTSTRLESFLRQPPDQPEQPEIAERRLMTMLAARTRPSALRPSPRA